MWRRAAREVSRGFWCAFTAHVGPEPVEGKVPEAQKQYGDLRFAAVPNLLRHAFKHKPRSIAADPQSACFPGSQVFMDGLVSLYQDDAQNTIKTFGNAVTSKAEQLGIHRTYYFGTVTEHVAMVAVNEAGHVWISTYYASGRY